MHSDCHNLKRGVRRLASARRWSHGDFFDEFACMRISNDKMCCAGASCRQLWVTAGAAERESERGRERDSERGGGALSDFPISPSRVRRAASTSRPTANRDYDVDGGARSSRLDPEFISESPCCLTYSQTRWVHRHKTSVVAMFSHMLGRTTENLADRSPRPG